MLEAESIYETLINFNESGLRGISEHGHLLGAEF
jgi:hypothetical protein